MKEAVSEINEQDSPLLTRSLLRIAIFNISYIRGLFPEEYFKDDESVSELDVKIKELMPKDAESCGLIDWMEKGVYDPLQRKYLKTLMFCIDGPMIEAYAFSFSYYSQYVTMNINRTGKHGGTFNYTADITPSEMSSSACKMVGTLIQLMITLDKLPNERTIVMKLLYDDVTTPPDYELPFLRGCAEEEAQYVWTKNPLRMEAGDVNSKHLVLTLKVKSVLDPCEDENVDKQDDGKSTSPDSVLYGQPSVSDSKVNEDRAKAFVAGIVADMEKDQTQAPIGKRTSTARLMEKAAQKKKTLVMNAFRRCLENYFTMQEIKNFMANEFPEGGIEEVAVKAALKGFLAFGTQKDKPENVSNMKAYLAHSSLCAKTRKGRIV